MKLLIGVTGSVAAKLTPKLVKAFAMSRTGIEIKVITTDKALYFFDPRELGSTTVLADADEWHGPLYKKDQPIPHIDLGHWADAFLIAPLSADTLSDMAHGKTDKLVTATVLAWPREKPMFLAPAMNTRMWDNPLTQENIETIKRIYGPIIVGPQTGMLACGDEGLGAMAHIMDIVKAVPWVG